MTKYNRSKDYRYQFIRHNPGYKKDYNHYHCVYCGKKILKKDMQVDHVISVNNARKNLSTKLYMWLTGMNDINDVSNLVSSCARCNRKKGKMSNGWVISAFFGRSYRLWQIRKWFRFIALIFCLYLLYRYLGRFNII